MKKFGGFILFVVALVLASFVLPIGFFFAGIIHAIKGGWNEYYRRCAISVDMTGNSFCGDLFNLMLAKAAGYKFGDPKETISSAIGKNQEKNTLTWFGRRINAALNKIQPNHSFNAIDTNV